MCFNKAITVFLTMKQKRGKSDEKPDCETAKICYPIPSR